MDQTPPLSRTTTDGRVNLAHLIRTTLRSKFPLTPVGEHRATCTNVEIDDSVFANAKTGDKVVRLTWEVAVPSKDQVGSESKYAVRSRPYGVYFSPTSALVQLIRALTGSENAYKTVDHDEDGNPVIDFDAGIFIGMQCFVVIAHIQSFGKTYANIAEHKTTDAQRAENSKRLPS